MTGEFFFFPWEYLYFPVNIFERSCFEFGNSEFSLTAESTGLASVLYLLSED